MMVNLVKPQAGNPSASVGSPLGPELAEQVAIAGVGYSNSYRSPHWVGAADIKKVGAIPAGNHDHGKWVIAGITDITVWNEVVTLFSQGGLGRSAEVKFSTTPLTVEGRMGHALCVFVPAEDMQVSLDVLRSALPGLGRLYWKFDVDTIRGHGEFCEFAYLADEDEEVSVNPEYDGPVAL